MKKNEVIRFFDRLAKDWDARQPREDKKINFILDCGNVRENASVLDVACGTGILIPYYLQRHVQKITAVDISAEMIKEARKKFAGSMAAFVNADIEEIVFTELYDCCIVYNAFPHFPEPARLIRHLASGLKKNGTLVIAHGLSRDRLNSLHAAKAAGVSAELMSEHELAALFLPHFAITEIISDEEKYVVAGQKLN